VVAGSLTCVPCCFLCLGCSPACRRVRGSRSGRPNRPRCLSPARHSQAANKSSAIVQNAGTTKKDSCFQLRQRRCFLLPSQTHSRPPFAADMADDADDALSAEERVLQLSAADEAAQRAACQSLLLALQQGDVTAVQLLQLDCLPPLLLLAQSTSAAAPSVPTAVPSRTEPLLPVLARRVLQQLQTDAKLRLFEAGWSVAPDATGRAVYRCTATKEERFVPPTDVGPPAASADALSGDAEPEWVSSLLLELPLLCSPVRQADGSEEWPVRVRYHRARALTAGSEALSVVDVRPESESGVAAMAGAGGAAAAAASAEGVSRQLVLGVWQGVGCSFRETEADLSYAPGTHLEAHYTATMAGAALLAAAAMDHAAAAAATVGTLPSPPPQAAVPVPAGAAASSAPALPPKRVLVIGLGGGALVSFLAQYAPHWTVEVVECNGEVARVAEQFFGVRFTRSLMEQTKSAQPVASAAAAAPTPAGLATAAGFDAPFAGPPCQLHLADAREFVQQADLAGCFDLVLLDVYTSGVFPPPLLNDAFFAQLKALLRPVPAAAEGAPKADGSGQLGGALLVNAGVGSDRTRVVQCARAAFGDGHCRLLLNKERPSVAAAAAAASSAATAVSASAAAAGFDSNQESCVLLAGPPCARFRDDFSVLCWRKRVAERQPADLPPLPFELQACKSSDAGTTISDEEAAVPAERDTPSTVVQWRGVQLDRLAARLDRRQTAAASAPPPPVVKMASKADSAWSLFD